MKTFISIVLLFFTLSLTTSAQNYSRSLGKKNFETSNHLGNVVATTFDRKIAAQNTPFGLVLAYEADILSYSDYYPYGMLMEGRNGSADYRYGFQGQERDDKIKGDGNAINYKYRMHDTRLGRFFAVDPLSAEYSYNSTYAFSENRVIDAIELEGLEIKKNTSSSTKSVKCKLNVDKEKKLKIRGHYYTVKKSLYTINIPGYRRPQNDMSMSGSGDDFNINFGINGGEFTFDAGKDIPDQINIFDETGKEIYEGRAGTGYNTRKITKTLPKGNYRIVITNDPDDIWPGIDGGSSFVYKNNVPELYLLVKKLKFLGITIAKRKILYDKKPHKSENIRKKSYQKNIKGFRNKRRTDRRQNRFILKKYGLRKKDLIGNKTRIPLKK